MAILGTRGYPSYYGGFETAVRRIAPYLVDNGWSVTVYGRRGATRQDDVTRDERVEAIETLGLEVKSFSTLSYGLSSTFHARRRRPDVALVMNVANGYWLPILRQARIPTLVNVDGIEWERAKWGSLAKSVFHRGARLTARHATRLVVDSEEIGRRWLAEFGRDGAFIPYGGDVVEERLPVPEGLRSGSYVLYVARLVPENSAAEFFEAVERISRQHPVVIVGSSGYGGPLDEAAETLARERPDVTWLGQIDDDALLHALWQHAGVYFHGHSVGGTNPALVQAMALGAPTVARDTPYNREVLADAGRYVDDDPSSIAGGVLDLMADANERAILRERARARAVARYTWEDVARSYESELRGLLRE